MRKIRSGIILGQGTATIVASEHEKVQAMKWWNDLSFEKKKFYVPNRNPSDLTGREIHIIYKTRYI